MKRQRVKGMSDTNPKSTVSLERIAEERAPGAPKLHHESAELNGHGNSVDHSHARISELAYGFYEQDGYRHGHHLEHWLRAEEEIHRQEA